MSESPPLDTPRPWGLSRMAAFPETASVRYAGIELDPDTQIVRYLDHGGRPIEMGRHGTGTGTSAPTGTSHDGRQDTDHRPDTDND